MNNRHYPKRWTKKDCKRVLDKIKDLSEALAGTIEYHDLSELAMMLDEDDLNNENLKKLFKYHGDKLFYIGKVVRGTDGKLTCMDYIDYIPF